MDQKRFDQLTVAFSRAAHRRTLLAVLSGALVSAGLLAAPEAAGKGQGKGKGRHRQGTGHAAPQRAGTDATSCAQKCRKKKSKAARRRCRKRCTPPTPACTTSQDCPAGELCEGGSCIPIPDQCTVNADCDACERCASGVCLTRCQPGEVCQNDQCVVPPQCTGDGQCGVCERCTTGRCLWRCQPTEHCQGGQCVPGCTPTTCAAAGAVCGTIPNGCGDSLSCGTCGGTTPICADTNTCVPCAASRPCPKGGCCTASGACLANGAACDDGNPCTTGERCQNGTCGGGTTRCTTPPPCRTAMGATCTPTGTCDYPPLGAGTACDSVPCGTCDGAGTCVGCTPPDTCGGGGMPNVCGTPQGTCTAEADVCTRTGDFFGCNANQSCACFTTMENTTACVRITDSTCGDCTSSAACGEGRVCLKDTGSSCACTDGQGFCQPLCNCTPRTTCPAGLNCGTIGDGCGGVLHCGSCTLAGESCGGSGVPNVCGNAQGTCQAGADTCTRTGSFFACNGNSDCACFTAMEDTTACVRITDSTCGDCTSNAECDAGHVCLKDTGSSCACPGGLGFCQPVCPPAA